MNDHKKFLIAQIIMILLAVGLGFDLAGAFYNYNNIKAEENYMLELQTVIDACKDRYNQRLLINEQEDKIILIMQ